MGRHEKTLDAIFATPTRANIAWNDIESLLKSLGAEVTEGRGSRVRMRLSGAKAVFHRPHPQRNAGKPTVESVRRFIEAAGRAP